MNAVDASCSLVEKALGRHAPSAFEKIEDRLYVVKQGSTYVMISVIPTGKAEEKAVVRVVAQVVSGVRPEPSLFRQLLVLNGTMRFGAFAYVPEGDLILFCHSILGGAEMDTRELVATVRDIALVADEYDDRIVARYGGQRMADVVEQSALDHLFGDKYVDEEL